MILTFRTYMSGAGVDVAVPRGLWIDARGEAPTIDDALEAFRLAAGAVAIVIAVSANAVVHSPRIHFAFENTPGVIERDFYSALLPEDYPIPLPARSLDVEATLTLIWAVFNSDDRGRIHRAINQYTHAITHWQPGTELLTVAHLFMGVDALTKIILEDEKRSASASTNKQLADEWNIDSKQLDAEIRRRIIFQGETEIQNRVSDISDAYEHGYRPTPELMAEAVGVRDKAAECLRAAILSYSGAEPRHVATLLSSKFGVPLPCYPITAEIRGKLIGSALDLALPELEYPLIEWNPVVAQASLINDGRALQMQMDVNFTKVSLAEGVSFQPQEIRWYGPPGDSVDQSQSSSGPDDSHE